MKGPKVSPLFICAFRRTLLLEEKSCPHAFHPRDTTETQSEGKEVLFFSCTITKQERFHVGDFVTMLLTRRYDSFGALTKNSQSIT